MKIDRLFKHLSINAVTFWLILFALIPFLFVLLCSFLQPDDSHIWLWIFTLENYKQLVNPIYLKVVWRSFLLAGTTTGFCLILGYPTAYLLARLPNSLKSILIFLLIIPFWTSSLIRIYAIRIILRAHGPLSHFLQSIHLIHHPLSLLYSQTAVLIGTVYSLLPFMIFPLYALLEKFDWTLEEAAHDLGATQWHYFTKIVFPLSLPAMVSGIILVFLPALTLFYIPDVLGGAKSLLLGNLIKNSFIESLQWPFGSAISVGLTTLMGLMLLAYWKTSLSPKRSTQP
jgi:spermidine/putrescine transport system permease protein